MGAAEETKEEEAQPEDGEVSWRSLSSSAAEAAPGHLKERDPGDMCAPRVILRSKSPPPLRKEAEARDLVEALLEALAEDYDSITKKEKALGAEVASLLDRT